MKELFSQTTSADANILGQAILTSELFYYISICLANLSVVEFIVALKGIMALWIVDYALRIIIPIWGLAGIVVTAVYLCTDFTVSVCLDLDELESQESNRLT